MDHVMMTGRAVWLGAFGLLLSCQPAPLRNGSMPDEDPHRSIQNWNSSTNTRCGECHVDEAAEFSTSAHARGLDSHRFRAEWFPERLAFCSDCHAPLGPPETEGAEQGVGCVACHASGRRDEPVRMALDDDLCATCHQFGFPTELQAPNSPYPPSTALQSTWEEWRRTDAAYRGQGCIDCHMSTTSNGHQMHIGPTDEPVLQVRTFWRAETLRLEISATDAVGHAVPTGDVFRALVVEAYAENGELVGQETLGRRFVAYLDENGQTRMNEGFDARVPPPGGGARVVELSGLGQAEPIRLEIAVIRSTTASAGTDRRLIWSGEVPARLDRRR